jgi:hypothetical protein
LYNFFCELENLFVRTDVRLTSYDVRSVFCLII